jgi:hypothetical protein
VTVKIVSIQGSRRLTFCSATERLKLRIHGRNVWEVLMDVSSLSDGSSKISALNPEDGEVDEFELLMFEN